jgi:tyrosine type site-specific recombinase
MTAGINILCYKSKTLANGEHPLMLRVCKDGKKKYISLGLSMAEQYGSREK